MAGINPITGRSGPTPKPGRDGDREQARARVNVQVQRGERPFPNALPCVDCGHVWKEGDRRHEYDHHLGYDAEHHLDVVPVCGPCHVIRTNAAVTTCDRGHLFTPENTIHRGDGRDRKSVV